MLSRAGAPALKIERSEIFEPASKVWRAVRGRRRACERLLSANPAKPPRLPAEGSAVRARCYVETGRPCFIFILIQISLLSAKLSVLNGTKAK